jgi:GntR family transcriptional regulator
VRAEIDAEGRVTIMNLPAGLASPAGRLNFPVDTGADCHICSMTSDASIAARKFFGKPAPTMIFKIDPLSPKPVYQQVIDQVKYAVASGRLADGDRIDPIRDVAVQTRVNRNTIARAYMELEREGVIRTRAGQGSFICGDGAGLARTRARRILSERIDGLLAQAHQFRLSEEDLLDLVRERLARVRLKGAQALEEEDS